MFEIAAAGIMLAAPASELRCAASSSEAMRLLELFELQAQDGPCLDCYRSGKPITNDDITGTGGSWSRFTPEATAAGFRSVYALPLRLRGAVIGALNLFHTQPNGMQPADLDVAQALADVATIAILQHQAALESHTLAQQLEHALRSRIVLEQAKGIIAERAHLSMELSFTALRQYSRNNNIKLIDAAQSIIDGTLAPASLKSRPVHAAKPQTEPESGTPLRNQTDARSSV
jgi:GAF domain-containing protein